MPHSRRLSGLSGPCYSGAYVWFRHDLNVVSTRDDATFDGFLPVLRNPGSPRPSDFLLPGVTAVQRVNIAFGNHGRVGNAAPYPFLIYRVRAGGSGVRGRAGQRRRTPACSAIASSGFGAATVRSGPRPGVGAPRLPPPSAVLKAAFQKTGEGQRFHDALQLACALQPRVCPAIRLARVCPGLVSGTAGVCGAADRLVTARRAGEVDMPLAPWRARFPVGADMTMGNRKGVAGAGGRCRCGARGRPRGRALAAAGRRWCRPNRGPGGQGDRLRACAQDASRGSASGGRDHGG